MFCISASKRSALIFTLIGLSGSVVANELNQSVEEFTKIRMGVGGTIELVPGDESRISLTVIEGELGDVQVEVRRGTLELKQNCANRFLCLGPFPEIEGKVYYRKLDALLIEGAAAMTAKDLSSTKLDLEIRGVGELDFGSVSADNFELTISGAGTLHAEQADFGDFSVDIRGVGDIEFGDVKSGTGDVTISGAGEFLVERAEFDDFSAKIRGVGDVEVEDGTTKTCTVHVAGGGTFDGLGLEAQTADVTVSGSGDVSVYASETLKVLINGAGEVTYDGDPQIASTINGVGDISRH